jgi:hypothetical protein
MIKKYLCDGDLFDTIETARSYADWIYIKTGDFVTIQEVL